MKRKSSQKKRPATRPLPDCTVTTVFSDTLTIRRLPDNDVQPDKNKPIKPTEKS